MRRRRPDGKTGDSEIEAAPEKMHRAPLAAEARAEFFQHALGLEQDAPETVGVGGIVGAMLLIAIERSRVDDFVRQKVDLDRQFEFGQGSDHVAIKSGYRLRP